MTLDETSRMQCFKNRKKGLLKYTCVEFISIRLPWENQIKKRKNYYPSVQKRYSTSRKGTGGHKEKEQNSKTKTTKLMYFDNLKKKQ